jgi:hypothetical protein
MNFPTAQSIKALASNQTFRKNVAQVAMVLIAAVTGSFIASKIDQPQVVEAIVETNVNETI